MVDVCTQARVRNYEGVDIGKTVTCTEYFFDMDEGVERATLPGLPLLLEPVAALRTREDEALSDEYDYYVDAVPAEPASARLVVDSLPDRTRRVRLRMLVAGHEYGSIELMLPPGGVSGSYEAAGMAPPAVDVSGGGQPVSRPSGGQTPVMAPGATHTLAAYDGPSPDASASYADSLRAILLHYYRGDTRYSDLQAKIEYVEAAVVGFVSPFVLLALVFTGAAFVVAVMVRAIY